jgi:hypothetical protein
MYIGFSQALHLQCSELSCHMFKIFNILQCTYLKAYQRMKKHMVFARVFFWIASEYSAIWYSTYTYRTCFGISRAIKF